MSAKHREITEKVNASFAENKPEVFLSYCADDIVWRIVGDKVVKGVDGIRSFMKSMDMEPPKFTVDNLFADGDHAMANGSMTMREKDNKEGKYSYCDIYRFNDGKIAELISYVVKTDGESEYKVRKTAA